MKVEQNKLDNITQPKTALLPRPHLKLTSSGPGVEANVCLICLIVAFLF